MAVEWALLAKVGAPLVGKITSSVLEDLTLPWRVSWRTSRRAALQSMKIRFFGLHAVLKRLDVLRAFQRGDWDHLKENEKAFAELINDPDDTKTTALLQILIESYIANLKPAEATATQGQRLETLVEITHQETTRQIDARNSDEVTFEPNLQLLSRFRAEEARNIKSIWPNVSRVVAEIVASPDRKQTIEAWAGQRPAFMQDMPVAAACWMGSLATDYGARTTATEFYEEAIANGAIPRSYWKARQAIAAGPLDKVSLQRQLSDPPHPLFDALMTASEGNAEGMRKHLQNWKTHTSEADCLRKLLLVDALNALGKHDEAITTALATAEQYGTASAHLKAAQNLLARGSTRGQANYLWDLQEGLRHALSARDTFRKWQGDSSDAVLTTMHAYSLLGDNLSAWKAMQPPPEGTATEREATSQKVRTESCLLSAELGLMPRARDLLTDIKDPGTIAQVKALIAESEDDSEAANRNWAEAFNHAADPGLGLSIATRMARQGLEIPVPVWEKFATSEINDLRLISDVFRKVEGSLQLARSRQLESRQVLSSLISFYSEQGNLAEAATTAELGAKRWHDPELWLTAAGFHHKLEHHTEASRCAESSLHAGGSIWRRRAEAYRVLVEAKSTVGDILEAAEYAARLFTEQPDDPGTQWALVTCQYLGGDVEGAWDTYKNRANEPQPRSSQEALTWLRLNRQFGTPFDIDRALDLADQWDEDEEVRATVLLAVMLTETPNRSESTQQRLTAAFEKFTDDFPKSRFLEPHEIDPDNLMGSLNQLMERFPDYREQQDQINAGLAPLGLASTMRNRSYADLIISGGAGVIYGGEPSTLEAELKILENTHSAVLDTTAMHSLVLLDNETSRTLLGTFTSATTTIEQYRDALAATDSTIFSSELSVYKDPETGRTRLSQSSPEQLEINRQRANLLLEMFKRTQRVSNPRLLRAPKDHRLLLWLSAADLAERRGTIFWCDDRVLRSYAAASGVQTVGTIAVLEMARKSGILNSELVDVAEAILIHNRFVGITFSPKVYGLAAEMSGWRPQGIAAAVMRHGRTDLNELALFVLNAIQHVLHAPNDVRDWVSAFAQWLVSVTGEPNRATEALIHWLWQLSDQDWMTPDLMVFASDGVRSAANKLEGIRDPLPQAMNLLYEDLVERTDESLAAQFLTGLVSRMNSEDKGTVLRNILMS